MLIELTQMRISAVIYAHLTVETEGEEPLSGSSKCQSAKEKPAE